MVSSKRLISRDRKALTGKRSKEEISNALQVPDKQEKKPGLGSRFSSLKKKRPLMRRSASQDSVEQSTECEPETSCDDEVSMTIDLPNSMYKCTKVEFPKEFDKKFMSTVKLTSNMVIENIGFDLLAYFLVGDQIVEINDASVINKKEMENAMTIPNMNIYHMITVIRPRNHRCATKQQLLSLNPAEDHKSNIALTYLVIRCHRHYKTNGFFMKGDKHRPRKISIIEVKPQTNAGCSFMVNDRICDINGFGVGHLKAEVKVAKQALHSALRRNRFVDVFIGRPFSLRSSQNQMVQGDLWSRQAVTNGVVIVTSIDVPPMDPELDCDTLEIALRELCRIEGHITGECVPATTRGRPILKGMAPQSAYIDVMKVSSNVNNKAEKKSFLKKDKKGNYLPLPKADTAITSDILEDVDLKKVEPKSGLVGFIKNMYFG